MAKGTQFDPQLAAAAIAARMHIPRSVEREDLIQAGLLGYCQCLSRHDATRAKINTYAQSRMRGAMLDYLRQIDPLTRHHRRAVKTGDAPEVETVHMDPDLPVPDSRQSFAGATLARVDVERLMAVLQPRYRRAVRLYYLADLRMHEVAAALGISQCPAWQIITAALRQMRAAATAARN